MFEECEIKETQSTKLLKGLTCFAACMMLVMSFMFVRNRMVFDEKIEYAQAHSDSKWLLLPNLPYPDYVYKGSQGRITEIFDREFKIYYGIDADTFISLAPYQQWKEFVYPSPDKSKDSEK
ncbi:MAG: hypothetical protein IJH57_02035 [Mogibacterium sp.]|nr:hypothetical protein [Mogibacterium sp.]